MAAAQAESTDQADPDRGIRGRFTVRSRLGLEHRVRLLTVAVWAAVLLVPSLVATGIVSSRLDAIVATRVAAAAPAAAAITPDPLTATPGQEAAVAGWAAAFVATWLGTGPTERDQLAGYGTGLTEGSNLDGGLQVLGSHPVGAEQVETGPAGTVWAITVAATVAAPPAGGTEPGPERTQHYRVGVLAGDSTGEWSLQVLTAPAAVPGPAPVTAAGTGYGTDLGADDPAVTAGLGFVHALLTGGDIERYLRPGLVVPTLSPPPYTSVAMVSAATTAAEPDGSDPDARELLLTVEATTVDGLTQRLAYPLTTAVRDGRWEVTGWHPAPLTGSPAPAGTPTPPGGAP